MIVAKCPGAGEAPVLTAAGSIIYMNAWVLKLALVLKLVQDVYIYMVFVYNNLLGCRMPAGMQDTCWDASYLQVAHHFIKYTPIILRSNKM